MVITCSRSKVEKTSVVIYMQVHVPDILPSNESHPMSTIAYWRVVVD